MAKSLDMNHCKMIGKEFLIHPSKLLSKKF